MIERGKESLGKKRESKYEKESEDEKTSVKIKRERRNQYMMLAISSVLIHIFH